MERKQRGRRGSGHTVMPRCPTSKYNRSGDRMSFRPVRIVLFGLVFLFLILSTRENLAAQTPTSGLNGVVTDPSGGVIAKAAVPLISATAAPRDTPTNRHVVNDFN